MDELFWASGGIGFFLLLFEIWSISKKKKCDTVIQGQFVRNREIISGPITCYFPIFRYNFNGIMYESQVFDAISKKIAKAFIGEQVYPIYINSKKPKYIVVSKKINFGDWLTLLMGTFFVFFSIIYAYTIK